MKPKPKRSTLEVHVPDDVILNHILARVPTKSVCRFNCVSKEWHSFLASDMFKNKHNQHVDDHKNNLKFMFLSKTETSFEFATIDCEEAPPSDKDLTPPENLQQRTALYHHSKRLLLMIFIFSHLFMVCCCEDDYKFLFVDYFDHNVYIYSLKSDSWRKVDVFQHTLHPGSWSRGDVTSVKLFYHDMIRRGFSLDTVTYNIRIESYSKQGISHYTTKAQELFDEIHDRYLVPDSGVYNALINAYIRSGNMMSATRVMNEMEENNILPDHVTFHTIHAVAVLLKSLCSDGRVEEAFQCGLQILEKGRYLSKTGFRVLERCLMDMGDEVKLKKRQIAVPVSRGHAMGISV
ncbi:pentatricopeptide repeat-containing protein [Tanacetum coccineum]